MGEIVKENSHDGGEQEEETVEIVVKTNGPLRPSRLKVPPCIKVQSLRALIAANGSLPIEIVSLIAGGSVLHDRKDGKEAFMQFSSGDKLMVVVKPKAARKKIPLGYDDDDDDEEEDEDDLKFQLPETSSRWKWKLFRLLRDKLHCPDIILMGIFSLSLKAWIIVTLWFIMAPVAHSWDLGPLFILATGFAIIFLNLGKRQAGDASAYSIFNEDFRELPGTLNADRLDRDIRAGQF